MMRLGSLLALTVTLLSITATKADYCTRNGQKCPDGTIRSVPDSGSFSLSCQQACDAEPTCKSAVLIKREDCILKNKVCKLSELVGATGMTYDYVKVDPGTDCCIYQETMYIMCHRPAKDCNGHDIDSVQTDDVEYCHQRCHCNDQCQSVQFNGRTCYLKSLKCTNSGLTNSNSNANDYVKMKPFVSLTESRTCEQELASLN